MYILVVRCTNICIRYAASGEKIRQVLNAEYFIYHSLCTNVRELEQVTVSIN